MKNHTNDPSKRAESIANREAEKVWRKTGDYKLWLSVWQDTYANALKELCSE